MGGVFDSFLQQRLKPLMEITGPVWRWKAGDPVAAALDPQSPEQFAKVAQIRDLLAGGLPLKVSVAKMGSDVGAVDLAIGGGTYTFSSATAQPRRVLWSLTGGQPEASVVLHKAGAVPAGATAVPELKRFDTEGPWALFRLIDLAKKENAGPTSIKVTFGEGTASVTFLMELPTDQNPFSRGGLWSFRCPTKL